MTMRGYVAAGAAVLVTGLASACSTVESEDVRTSGITPTIVVTALGDGAEVVVTMSAGGMTSVELGGEDRLVARSGDVESPATGQRTLFGQDTYYLRLGGVTAPGTEVEVSFERGADDTSVTSRVALPPPLRVTAPRDQARTSRGRDLRIRVNRAAGRIRVRWEGACVSGGFQDYAEGEPVVVRAGTMQPPPPPSEGASPAQPAAPERCLVTLTVTRIVDGSLGEGYDGGSIRAERSTSLVVDSRP